MNRDLIIYAIPVVRAEFKKRLKSSENIFQYITTKSNQNRITLLDSILQVVAQNMSPLAVVLTLC